MQEENLRNHQPFFHFWCHEYFWHLWKWVPLFFFLFGFAALSQNHHSSCVRFIFHTFERWRAESAILLSLDFFNIYCLKLFPVFCSCDYVFQSSLCSKKGHKSQSKSQLDRYQGIDTSDTQYTMISTGYFTWGFGLLHALSTIKDDSLSLLSF